MSLFFAWLNKSPQDGNTALHNAASGGKLEVLELLLARGADTENTTEEGSRTALHEAALAGELPAVQMLLAAGVNLNSKDEYGETPLFKASSAGEAEVVRALLASPEALLNVMNTEGRSVRSVRAPPAHR